MVMDLEVVGRHALLFDDDAMAAFVNSGDALVDWNSLLIDRYDVRHLLSAPPPPRKRRQQQTHSPPFGSSAEPELDHERYLDLPPPTEEEESDVGAKSVDEAGFHSVAFSYGNAEDSNDQKNYGDGMGDSGFRPPFPIPESLLQCLPPTEKLHQIIARTALFVGKHGGQSEIVLRVKQGDNPTFGFLMPDHHLHAYFRFLIDHQDLLQPDTDGKSENEKKGNAEYNQKDGFASGALSLLGSVYGSGEDEDIVVEGVPECKENEYGKTLDARDPLAGHGSEKIDFLGKADEKDEGFSKHSSPHKEKFQVLSRNSLMKISKAVTANGKKKEGYSISLNPSSSASNNASKIEPVILEPPSDIRRLVDKVVEFILKNGKQFEAVLTEQDSKYGRFPFLLPSNQFHPYYVNVLQKAQESNLTGKGFPSKNDDSMVPRQNKKSSLAKESDAASLGLASGEIPYDYDRKERFKMVLGKSKKDGEDPSSRTSQSPFGVSIDAAQTAAILQAATRGIRNPNFGTFSNTSLSGETQKSQEKNQTVPGPVAKVVAKTAAREATNEADSTEAHMTREQKLKAERLKRAKMFVSMLKGGAAPIKSESPRSLSVEPQEPGVSGKEREGSSVPLNAETSERKEETEKKHSDDEFHERRSKRKYRSRSTRYGEEEVEEENEVGGEKEKNDRHSRKHHRSHRSSREEGKEEEEEEDGEDRGYRHVRRKHRSHRSSHKDEQEEDGDRGDRKKARKKHRSHHSSEEEYEDDHGEEKHHKDSKRKHRSHHSSRHRRDRHGYKERHSSSKNSGSRHRRKHELSNDEDRSYSSSEKRRKIPQPEEELEEGEISFKISDQSRGSASGGVSREASIDLSSSYRDGRTPPQPPEATEISDDLRAKIRAMLMANF